MTIPLSLLYAPADRPERFLKALNSGAHAVIFDLEDAVAASKKEHARTQLREFFAWQENEFSEHGYEPHGGLPPVSIQVRINAHGTPWCLDDAALVADLPSCVGVRVAKVESATQVTDIAKTVGERNIFLLLETALGVERAYELATCHPRIAGMGLGEADLRSELGVSGERGLEYARSRIVYASHAAGVQPPSMAVYASVSDLDGLRDSCIAGKALGLLGRTAIHPRQLETIHEVFSPTAAEVEHAQQVIESVAQAQEIGSGTVVLADGTFLDAAMVNLARMTVRIAHRA
ncbi:HpcH/HpaI aldolase/citrate lyase family protein [Timonella sp. A28]|uniref:HpcH/HpaI aldolase/citrate lyase family protein n=1 Tax=Timonella sp. A28 TaxID=3442640 RepID=UPI003EB900BF